MDINNRYNTDEGSPCVETIEEADIEDYLDRMAVASHSQEITIMLQSQLIWVLEQRIMYYESLTASDTDRQLIKDANNTGLGFLSRQLDDALAKDDKSLNGFNPPRTLRFVVGLLLVAENVVVMLDPAAGQQISLASVSSQAGRLCFLNMLPLSLLVMPENSIMPRLVRQCREQWLWLHAFLGYLVAAHYAT
ncbi:hypothetical protein CCHR01_19641 [Colletotrichum chrysophilum]|uniref:Uncharacterized protein n=1 Tax=Colletotrichum chrysophilum TaxID=1836956 RepID=A0AAD9EA82_9PEZI|nr:hypothetical protein CCHR01_19641 [Colletotrichum chrysophilum]